jgi:hypothetical protein
MPDRMSEALEARAGLLPSAAPVSLSQLTWRRLSDHDDAWAGRPAGVVQVSDG